MLWHGRRSRYDDSFRMTSTATFKKSSATFAVAAYAEGGKEDDRRCENETADDFYPDWFCNSSEGFHISNDRKFSGGNLPAQAVPLSMSSFGH